jgi:hypothetical protein
VPRRRHVDGVGGDPLGKAHGDRIPIADVGADGEG